MNLDETATSFSPEQLAQILAKLYGKETVREKTTSICNLLLNYDLTKHAALDWAHHTMGGVYSSEIVNLSNKSSGLHFSAGTMTEERLRSFDITELSQQMEDQAPAVWMMLNSLFSADSKLQDRRSRDQKRARAEGIKRRTKVSGHDGDIEMDDVNVSVSNLGEKNMLNDHDEYDLPSELHENEPESDIESEDAQEREEDRRQKHITIKKVISISMMLQSTNSRCNALQSIIGVFLQSCNCPETLRELLSRIGLSISQTTINEAINNLSAEADKALKALGRTLLALLGYDNIDFDLKHSVPTVEKADSTLIHLTSGTMMPLPESVKLSDLDCSEELWKKSPNNPSALQNDIPKIPFEDLLTLYSETEDSNKMLRRDRFNAWKFLHDLVYYGPEYFQTFKRQLGDPEEIDCIPIAKTTQIPCRTLDIHPSTPAQNADALASFFQQAGVGDSRDSKGVKDIDNHVVLVFGDLLTGERIRSLLESRGEEATPWRRMQFCVYVMGLFHLKMAAADAIWRVLIHPKKTKTEMDDNSLMSFVSQIRPKETGKIESNPGFRRMHEVIQHTGIVSRLDSWRVEAQKINPTIMTLEDYAESKPSWEALQKFAIVVTKAHVATREPTFETASKKEAERDKQWENALLRQRYFLLYEELSHALNFGDIGRTETCFLPWMFIFLGCGKHKYAAELRRYLENVHFIYPQGLRNAIRMSILCNPTGKKGSFRAIDWVVEHNNLYTKRIYGGKFSNHQVQRILAESPLIEVYKNTRIQFEKMFCLENKTARHAPPNMQATFTKLAGYMAKQKSNEFVAGRSTRYSIPDVEGKGMIPFVTEKGTQISAEDDETAMGADDDDAEMEDDGSLDA